MESLIHSIIKTFDELAPTRIISFIPYPKTTYVTGATREMMKLRDRAKQNSDKFPHNNSLESRYQELRRTVKCMIKSDTKAELDRKIHLAGQRSCSLWPTSRKLRLRARNSASTNFEFFC
jgi:hypothetical protein